MRSTCREFDIPTPAWGVATDLEQGLRVAGEIGYPLMCKPTDNQSSKGVFRITDESDLVRVFPEVLAKAFSGRVILEEYMDGQEYIVDGLSIQGAYKSLLMLGNENFNLKDICIPRSRSFPTDLPDYTVWELLMLDRKVNTSFGLANGLSHNEYLLDPRDQKFFLIDAAARGGGAFISSHLLPFACGFDTAEMLIRMALGEAMDINAYSPGAKAVSYMCFYLKEGVIRQVKGLDTIKEMDFVLGVHEANLVPGTKAMGLVDKSCRLGPVLIGCKTLPELNNAREIIRDTLVISTDNSENAVIWE
jgi:carbamoyl-phosphate synthase large subunit